MDAMPQLSLIIPPDVAPERFVPIGRAAESVGVDELWVWEDCFAESGSATAAALLAATERVRVGIGLMPVPLRAVALTAMEIATLERIAPGRVLPGVGHGVLEWMGQAGVRAQSPLTLLREHAEALRRLLAGEAVSVEGRYVQLDRVQLRWPPADRPLLYLGAQRPKTLALAAELADGVILAGDATPESTRAAVDAIRSVRAERGLDAPFEVVQFRGVRADASAAEATDLAAALADAGATSVPIFALDRGGRIDAGDGILRLAETIGSLGA
ncbi:LLM class flavin-dependent oxidoreductase [Agrococcus sp. TF02-05]|uniref:LLM class flavin-dependent oxidoreductase n=1 Tax=Agrococcus sp. TF02-05 TaxID=2815211 RepID=UPI001FB6C477|nr:LLM class flavin-dependent oxidoreductase [Agrococcus sp. TF02-05]